MANLRFYYGTMSSGKTMALLMAAYNLRKRADKNIKLLKPSIDTKANDSVQTRVAGGIEQKVDLVLKPEESLVEYFEKWAEEKVTRVLVDEAQFLTEEQVKELWYFTKVYKIPVDCYGLKSQFDLHFFQGSKPLMEYADEILELQTIAVCTNCGEKATINARYKDGNIELPGGERIVIDGSAAYEYRPLCGECYIKEVEELTGKSFIEIPKQKIKKPTEIK